MTKKLVIAISILFLFILTGCERNKLTEFERLFKVDNPNIHSMTYAELIELAESKSGVVFIAKSTESTRKLGQIFCDQLCECDVNKAHYVNPDDIIDNQLLTIFNVQQLNYPIIASFKKGELVGYYDSKTSPEDIEAYLYELISAAYPTVCSEAC